MKAILVKEKLLALVFAMLLVFTWWVYQPALSGPFLLDDYDNLGALAGGVDDVGGVVNYLSHGNAGPLGRPISKLSFLLNDNAWPSTADTFKRTNLLIHLMVGVFIFATFRLVFRQLMMGKNAAWLALGVAAIFLLHPIQVSTVMYVVQRMTQLASLFVMVGVFFHCYLRLKFPEPNAGQLLLMAVSAGFFTLLAAFSKEMGALLPVYLLVIESTILGRAKRSRLFCWWLRLVLWLPSIAIAGYLCYLPRWIPSYKSRDFSLGERLLTEPIVLLEYLLRIANSRVHGLGLFHDDYVVYTRISDPQVFLSLFAVIASIVLSVVFRKRAPLIAFGVLWFFAGHLIESTTVSLELYFEHRNYLPIIGPVVVLAALVVGLLRRVSEYWRFLSGILAAGVLLITGFSTAGYASEWRSFDVLAPIWSSEHPDSPRAQRTYAQLLASKGMYSAALFELDAAHERFPNDVSIPLMSIAFSCLGGEGYRYELQDLVSRQTSYRITDGLRPAAESLFKMLGGGLCSELIEGAHVMAKSLFELEGAKTKKRVLASVRKMSGDIYYKQGDFYPALEAFALVDQIAPSPSSALRLSDVFFRIGDLEQMKSFLLLARKREESHILGMAQSRSLEYQAKLDFVDDLQKKYGR